MQINKQKMTTQYVPFSDGFARGTLGREVYLTDIRDKWEKSESFLSVGQLGERRLEAER